MKLMISKVTILFLDDKLFISQNCHLILPTHIALDQARERSLEKNQLEQLEEVLDHAMKIKYPEKVSDF